MFRTKNCAAILQTGYLGWSTINSGTENRSILVSEQSPVLPMPIPNPATNADAPAHGARHRFPIGLKPTLVSSIVGLVLLSSLAIGVCAGLLIFSSTRAMIRQAEKAAASAATEETQNFFNVGPEITSDLAAAAQRGLLPLD